ncbi:MAG: glycosyltransferase, partial [bacterium]
MSKISVITPSFNRAAFVEDTLLSLVNQNATNWECIIVDDGSTDNSLEIISSYARYDQRFKLFKRERGPKGACTCRNIGVEKSCGEYLIFLDTDDLLAPHCIEQRIEIMEQHPELDLSIFPAAIFENEPYDVNKWWNIETDRDLLTRQLHQDAICQGTGCIWKRSSFVNIGMWNESHMIWQDIDLFLRTWIQDYRCRVCFDCEVDLHYRRHASLSRSNFFQRAKVESRCQVIRNAVHLMIETGKTDLVRETRFLLAETVVGATRGLHHDLARDLLDFGISSNVLNRHEGRILSRVMLACRTRAWRWSPIRKWLQSQLGLFRTITFLGKVDCSEPLIQTTTRSQNHVKHVAKAGV